MIGDVGYRFENIVPGDPDGQFLVKLTVVDPATVIIGCDDNGAVTIMPRDVEAPAVEETDDDDEAPEPAQQLGPKYRLEPEGNLFRLYALRSMPNVDVGSRGGLVASPSTLSHQGNCWVTVNAKVASPHARIVGGARITGDSQILGAGLIGGEAHLSYVHAEGPLSVSGSAQLHDTRIEAHDYQLHLEGTTYIIDSIIEPTDDIRINGCNVEHGHIHNNFEVVSVHTAEWGWLSAFRNHAGTVTYAIGCKRRHDIDELLSLAADHVIDPVQQDMLRAFVALAEAARPGWDGYVAPEPVMPEQRPISFADLAEKARAVKF